MASEIGNRIRNYLFLNKEINLPGIGMFKIYHIDQYLSNNETIIHPPFVKIRFKESDSNEKHKINLQKYYYDKTLESKLKGHFQEVINEVLNFGEAEIEGLGILKRMKNREIVFIPKDLLDIENKYLPIIDTHSFQTTEEKVKEVRQLASVAPVSTGTTQMELSHDIDLISPKNTVSKISYKAKTANKAKYRVFGFVGLGTLIILFFVARQCFYNGSGQSSSGVEESMMSISQIGEIYNDEIENENENAALLSSANSSIEKCIIIIGSFKERTNALRLKSVLASDGLTGITISYSDMTRVGFEFECEDLDLENYLSLIKSKYNDKAWYYQPQITF